MSETGVFADVNGAEARLRICGRATFIYGQDLQEFFTRALSAGVKKIVIDATACASMDSTFMGVLAMAALEKEAGQATLEIASPQVKVVDQLKGLGILRYFTLTERTVPAQCWIPLCDLVRGLRKDESALRETMLKAHEALGAANPDNIDRFRQVVELLKKEAAS